jgi:predicted DCC family thiol-disulfide oxidoreductase YuxK
MSTSMNNNYPLTLLYDGACPVCNMEMDNLKARNTQGRLKFVDISAPFFDTTPYGATLAELNGLIHAVRPDGSLVIGVEVLRLAYSAVGLGHLVPTGWPVLKPVFDMAYAVFARNRYGFSAVFSPVLERVRAIRAARRTADIDAAARKTTAAASACHEGHCSQSNGPNPTINNRSAS